MSIRFQSPSNEDDAADETTGETDRQELHELSKGQGPYAEAPMQKAVFGDSNERFAYAECDEQALDQAVAAARDDDAEEQAPIGAATPRKGKEEQCASDEEVRGNGNSLAATSRVYAQAPVDDSTGLGSTCSKHVQGIVEGDSVSTDAPSADEIGGRSGLDTTWLPPQATCPAWHCNACGFCNEVSPNACVMCDAPRKLESSTPPAPGAHRHAISAPMRKSVDAAAAPILARRRRL